MSQGFSIKTKNVRNIGDGILLQAQGIEALQSQVEDIKASYRNVGSYADDITRNLNMLAQKLKEQGNDFRVLSEKLEAIVARYESTEKAIREGSVYSDIPSQIDGNVSDAVSDDVNSLDDLINILAVSDGVSDGAGLLVSVLQWLKELEKISSSLPFDKIGDGLTIGSMILSIAKVTLENIKNGNSLNSIIADIFTEAALTLGEWTIQTGCKSIGMAVGSSIPVVGTAVGGVIGDAVGFVAAEAFDFVMSNDFDGDGKTGADGMSDVIEETLDHLIPDGRAPLSFAGA